MTVKHHLLKPGQTLGRNYYILDILGRGWEGIVYKVEERQTGIVRAAKLFYNRPTIRKDWLRRYARKLFTFRHCSIIMQYHHRDVARVGGETTEIMVSDFIDGIKLSDFIAVQPGKRMREFEALHLLHTIASGVEQIHTLREYHGDIHSENLIVQRHGLGFKVGLIDFFDIGRPTKSTIQVDVYDLINLLFECIGGQTRYARISPTVKTIIRGRKKSLIRQRFKNAGELRIALENLEWNS